MISKKIQLKAKASRKSGRIATKSLKKHINEVAELDLIFSLDESNGDSVKPSKNLSKIELDDIKERLEKLNRTTLFQG